ncbi:MAG TPA: AMP-binding protein [Solirubrobacteraceae bacterium]|nr:AMP-binding protein [Solirubrobacteraceae bacterium]
MLDTALAQLRFAASLAFGAPFHVRSMERIVAAMRATRDEFGALGSDANELLAGPQLDDDTRRDIQLRRLRKQTLRALRETPYYERRLADCDVDPARLRWEDIARLPVTPKEVLRDDPDALVSRRRTPFLRATTTGTTGEPASVWFSEREVRAMLALSAMSFMTERLIEPDDVVHVGISARGTLGVMSVVGASAAIGACAHVAGALGPQRTLALLAAPRGLPGKRRRASVATLYPSALGELVEHGVRAGYRPRDFGLRRILLSGEVATAGLRRRCQALFGDVELYENYAMTEIAPFGGTLCADGHLHFEPSTGLVEVLDLDGAGPAAPGRLGTIVATPFAPYRDTTLLLRYDTGDLVRTLADPPTCSLRATPATSAPLGKRALAVGHEHGWTTQRDVLEALEDVPVVPLPARCALSRGADGVEVQVVARSDGAAARAAIADALESRAVPLRRLRIHADRAELVAALPARCDLRETTFDIPAPPTHAAATARAA